MLTARDAAIRLLKLMMVASLVLPAILFAFAAWVNYRNTEAVNDERIERSLDILHEHALKVFQTIDRTFAEIREITRGMSDADMRANEAALHARLAHIVQSMPQQLQDIVVIDRDGHPLVSSGVVPVPKNLDLSHRDYFEAERDGGGTYVSGVHRPLMEGFTSYFFSLSQRRPADDGSFNGVISIAVLPSYFESFYARMGRSEGSYFGMARADGSFLARLPAPKSRVVKLDPRSKLREGIARGLDRSIYSVDSQIDGVDRRIGYRKLTGYPIYVLAGVERSAIVGEWARYMSSHLIFGLPATALLFVGFGLALRRTRRLYDEADRREAAEGALRQAQRLDAIGQMTGGIAHDFNNLLMIVSGSVQRLRGELVDNRHVRLLDMIATATQRGENLTRQLLTYSRQQTLMPQVIDLAQRLPALREMLTRSLRPDIEIKVEVPDEVCAVRVDPAELEIAIINLAVNAKDAMPKGGALSIRAKPVVLKGEATAESLIGEFIAVRVSDTGAGIPADILPRVFEPFFTTKEVGKGTGLGLSQVYGFAKQSGGTATITSAEGGGTAITLYLPRSHEAPLDVRTPPPEKVAPGAAGTVLLVEDNSDVAEVAAGYLRELGYRVRNVADARAALAALRADAAVDLVFSDILMPGGMNGLELARAVSERFPGIPVLLATGYSASAQEAVRKGIVVLQKPYDLEALRRHMREAMDAAHIKRRQEEPAG